MVFSDGGEPLPERDFGRGFLPLVSRGVFADVPGDCHEPVKNQFVGEVEPVNAVSISFGVLVHFGPFPSQEIGLAVSFPGF